MKKVPERTCIVCNIAKSKNDLIRIVKNNQGQIFVDKMQKANGRGAYICNNIQCLEKAIKTKRLEKAFKIEIESQIYDNLRGEILGK